MVAGDVLLAVSVVVFGIMRDSPRLGDTQGPPVPRPYLFSMPAGVILSAHVAGGLLLLARRYRPSLVAVLLALLAVLVPVPSAVMMTYSVARYCSRVWVAFLLAVALVGGMLLGGNLFALLGLFDWSLGDPYSLMLIGALLTAVGLYQRARTDLRAAVQDQIRQAARERDVAAELRRLRERAELAVDLHDAVARWLTLMTLCAATLGSVEDPDIRNTAGDLRRYGARALTELQAMIAALTQGADGGPVTAGGEGAGRLLALAEPGHPAPVTVHVSGLELLDLSGMDLATAIAAEAVLNAHKHAPGAAVRVDASVRSDRVHVVIDNTAGGLPDRQTPGSGLGLRSLRDRCTAAGGQLRSGPNADGGYRLAAEFPLGGRSAGAAGLGSAAAAESYPFERRTAAPGVLP